MISESFAEPPDAVLSGDTVPPENHQDELQQAYVEELVNKMAHHDAYCHLARDERIEKAKEIVENHG